MESHAAAADMSLDDIRMCSKDLLDKEEIDSGGFGKVYLCCHRKHGLVALKTVFTGLKTESYNNDLYKEAKIMYKLSHERIVKLLGIILEDGNYALVIEYMTKGNLLHVLKQVTVPVSVKARFILEIIEGMEYLHNQKVIHKDLKPENILADDEFHVKIADLGVAAFQKWSSLTREETDRQKTQSGAINTKNAGTLSYMAPEHLRSLNAKATVKSDIYSFAIVIWVILSNKEPYENAINNEQISICVQNGDRPEVEESLQCGLTEASDLMVRCWTDKPEERPTFQECKETFRPIYCESYEKNVTKDVATIQKSYPKPNALIQRMASLQLDCDAEPPSIPRDDPLSLHSSVGFQQGQVDEHSFTACSNEPVECEEERFDDHLVRKLANEMNYHQTGSRIDNSTNLSNPPLSDLRSRKVFSEGNSAPAGSYYPYPVSMPFGVNSEPSAPSYTHNNVAQSPYQVDSRPVDYHPAYEPQSSYYPVSHAGAWNTPHSAPHNSQNLYTSNASVPFDSTKLPVTESERPNFYSLPSNQTPQNHTAMGHVMGAEGNSLFPKGNFEYSSMYPQEKSVNLTISNSTAFQIGNNNYLNVGRKSDIKSDEVTQGLNDIKYRYADVLESSSLLNDSQMQLLRDNLARKWKAFARKVGLHQPEIEEIDHDWERDGLKEKVYQMLYKWQMKEGSKNITVGKVASALCELRHTELLNQLIMLNQNNTTNG
ncbi:receptor-interacting serine/threonine-protein kinase 1 isoform X2 [Dendrobates tinctorius]|uniref:receptor-interacting serine/threonine-protein kinase 1 isoform X2 n=1 Tax=Dendrobates tinctorius TaxID=92724 RepID=UPI003CC99ADD